MENKLIIGTRGSRLALVQSEFVKSLLEKEYPQINIEIKIIKTKGDIIQNTPLAKIGDKGLFTKEIEDGLLINSIDIAVHSMKDLPTKLPDGLTIGAILEREDPRDAFISKKYQRFADLPANAVIATSSLRRQANVLMHRPDLKLTDIRGNVDTRLRKLVKFEYDGMLLAVAGLKRSGFEYEITEIISEDIMMPAIAQGALGIEIRENDELTFKLLSPLRHEPTTQCVKAERAFLNRLEGGCQVPIGALGRVENNKLILKGIISDLDGKPYFKGSLKGELNQSEKIGKELAEQLLDQGAQEILERIYREQRK